MSDLGFNKIAAAALATGLALIGLNSLGESFFHQESPEKPGYLVEVAESDSGHDDGPKWTPPIDYGVLLANADIAAGEKKAGACVTCHKFEKGAGALQGPELWNVVMREKAGVAGFGYSSAMEEFGGVWDYEALDAFLKSPKKYIKNTAMNYAGLSKEKDRMNMIAYLRSRADTPAPLPAALPPEAFIEPTAEGHADEAHAAPDAPAMDTHGVEEVMHDAAAPVVEAADTVADTMHAAGDTATDMVDHAVDQATDTVTDAAETAAETAKEAAAPVVAHGPPGSARTVRTMLDEAADTAEDTMESTVEAAEETTTDIVKDAEEHVEGAMEH